MELPQAGLFMVVLAVVALADIAATVALAQMQMLLQA
jgi:hypothetical protein